jgi:hypothetical protein
MMVGVGATPATDATKAILNVGTAIASGSANGNMLGINAPSGFTGNLIQAEIKGADAFVVDNDGDVIIPSSRSFQVGGTLYSTSAVAFGNNAATGIYNDNAGSSAGIYISGSGGVAATNYLALRGTGGGTPTEQLRINGDQKAIMIGQKVNTTSLSSTSLYVSDRTATTGDTRVAIEGGAGQAADLFAVFAYNATPLAGTKHVNITSAGVLTMAAAPVLALTGLVQGNGSSAATAITNSSTVGQVLRVTGASTYAWGALDLADTDAVTGTLPGTNVQSASTTVSGVAEAAIDTEVTTGTDAARYVTPDALAGSTIFGTKVVEIEVYGPGVSASTGDGKTYFYIPPALNGMNLVGIRGQVYTAGTTNTINVDIARCVAAASGNICSSTVADVLSTNLTIDSAENASDTAATAAVIDTANDDVATGQVYRIDIDAVHTTPSQGLLLILTFQLP